MAEAEQPARPVWCIAANVVQQRPYGPGGQQTRRGIRLFGPGAKVWVPDGYGGMGYETVVVVGRTRHSPRYAVVSAFTRSEDRSSEAYRDDLLRMATMLQRISDEAHQHWTMRATLSRPGRRLLDRVRQLGRLLVASRSRK